MACRTGCPTQDHGSWGECARASRIGVAWVQHIKGLTLDREKKHNAELRDYQRARHQGVQPRSTRRSDIDRALKISDEFGKPYDSAKPTKVMLDGAA